MSVQNPHIIFLTAAILVGAIAALVRVIPRECAACAGTGRNPGRTEAVKIKGIDQDAAAEMVLMAAQGLCLGCRGKGRQ